MRAVIHDVEKSGCVEFELAGHHCTRPASVCQGEEDDRLATMHCGLRTRTLKHVFSESDQSLIYHFWKLESLTPHTL